MIWMAASFTSTALPATTTVSSLVALQAAINSANAGDNIIVSSGTYTTTSPITITRAGTANAPIIIQAATIGGAVITGSSGFQFNSPAAWVTVEGFTFTHTGDQLIIAYGTSHCRLSRNYIQLTIPAAADQAYVRINGDDVEFDHNELRNKNSIGQGLDIQGDGIGQVARRLWVHHNYFHDFVYQNGANGVEAVRWGLGLYAASTGVGLMEHNLFDHCDGEVEMVSNKSCGNIYRYNTFTNTVHTQFTLRQGNDCTLCGNYFSNTVGLRIFGDRHQIYSNYFAGNSAAIEIGNGDSQDIFGGANHDQPDNCVIVFNTLVNNTKQFWMDTHYTLGASSTTFANNLVVGGGSAATFGGTYASPVWGGNIVWNTTVGSISSGGYTSMDPLLVAGTDGVYHLAANSPAIGAATGNYPLVLVDIDGQTRPSTGKDIGADQNSSTPATAHFLTPGDVGPLSIQLLTPVVIGVQKLNATNCSLTFSGQQWQTWQVQQSTDLLSWTLLSSGTFGISAATVTDSAATTPRRFYRIISP
jgi:poly(beta-D-mannuronate) lyase